MITSELTATGLAIDVRAGELERDAVDGMVPGVVLEPHTGEGVAACLAWAARHGLSVIVRGAGTKREWGRPPRQVGALLSTRRLNRVLAHQHGDLTVNVQSGASLADLNRALAAHGQRLPLDPPFAEGATVGGLLATNDSGPLRHRYGTPRDLVLGVELATVDGRIAKAGGQVVKNVAGYDLSKLISGSFGSLAVIVSATFKLAPLPSASRTLVADAGEAASLQAGVAAIVSSQLEPEAFEVQARRSARESRSVSRLLLRFASLPAVVEAQAADASARLGGLGVNARVLAGAEEHRAWTGHARVVWDAPGAVVRVSWLPANLPQALAEIDEAAGSETLDLVGRAAAAAGLVRLEGSVARQAEAIERLRRSKVVGNVVVVRATPELKNRVDVWPPGHSARVFEAVKRAMDPAGTLGAGRGA